MVARMWPNGVQLQTAAPIFIPINSHIPGKDAVLDDHAPFGNTRGFYRLYD
ncbi:hypothetical protein [Paenibacillus sp. UNC451MF]|uniref:hypothetical protein n=1 Tax=Paenibacillus sp. UNC451MF TaxID=1449063 RepID=UPI000B1AE0EB|nr:hypothetical protein [Paenibacillus sp. UNC451MF]